MAADLDLPNKSPNAPASIATASPTLLSLPIEILTPVPTHLRPTADPTQNIVFLGYGEHGICYDADSRRRCDELRGLVHILLQLDKGLEEVARMALRDEEELENGVPARCRQRIRDAVRTGCDWSVLTHIVQCWRMRLID